MGVVSTSLAARATTDYHGSKAVAWMAFTLTLLLYVFDFVDRQIVVSMLPSIKSEWSLSDTQLGALISIVSLTVAIFSVPVAIAADRWSRVKCIFAMGFIWSLMTVACGYATSYFQLLSLRGLIGIGEAGYGAVGLALLSTLFPSRMRAVILAAFSGAAIIGSIIGVVLGGVISQHYGWHSAFGIVGVPGLVLSILFLFVPDYKTAEIGTVGSTRARKGLDLASIARTLLETPSALLVYLCNALQFFVFGTIVSWLPSFLNRVHGLPIDQAGIRTTIVLVATSLGAMLWGAVADRVSRDRPSNKFLVLASSAFCTFAALTVAFNLLEPGPMQFAAIVLGGLFLSGTVGTVPALVADVAHPGVRATAMAVGALIQNLLGMAAGPFISGMISDRFGLSAAFAFVPLLSLFAAVAFLATRRVYERDIAHAAERRSLSDISGGERS